ncbi:MAG TPA: glycoside hydrolase family 127 protein [Pontiellaceae bacterium]|nr:glycoside hydrolase family 127 protein [Pontiellaceae bacterium]
MNAPIRLLLVTFFTAATRSLFAAEAPADQFKFLHVGEVQPRGWLLEQIRMDMTNGYGPVMDKLTPKHILPTFFDSAKKTTPDKTWWPGETTGVWLDGLVRAAYLSGDEPAKRRADELVTQILAMQEADGYLGVMPKAERFQSPIHVQNGDLWTQACLYRGLLAYYELTGREDVLSAVQRATQLVMSKYGPDRPYWPGSIGRGGPPHSLMFVDVCEELYRLTGDRSYVAFAKFMYDGYNAIPEVREFDSLLKNLSDPNKPLNGHGAHTVEHMRVPLFLAYTTGEAKYRAAADNFLLKLSRHQNAGGACISDEDILERAGSPYIGSEYCTQGFLVFTLQSGVEKTRDVKAADAAEVLAFNYAQGARLRDGKGNQYCSVDNQYAAVSKKNGGRMKLSPTHEEVAACCSVGALCFFPYFTDGLWMKTADGRGLVAVNYAPNELRTSIKDVKIQITSDTGYPFEDEIRMTVTPEKPVACSIRLRIPAWAGSMNVVAAGATMVDDSGWRVLTKEWKKGDHITVSFKPDVERKTMANGEVYWKRGPLVYALPIPSESKQIKTYPVAGFGDYEYTPKAGAFWDYAAEEKGEAFNCVQSAVQGNPWITAPVRLTGRLINRKTGQSEPVELQPMGVNLLRRVAFPQVKGAKALEAQAQALKSDLNLARSAKVAASTSASSSLPEALVDGVAQGLPDNPAAEWTSNQETTGAKVKLTWAKPVKIEDVWLFDRPNEKDQVLAAWINFSDGTSAMVGELPNDGTAPFQLNFPEKIVKWMEVIITRVGPKTMNAGFSEIAVFQKAPTE